MRLALRTFAIAVMVSVGGAATGMDPEQSGSVNAPNIVLITLDTTRADRMGFLGSKRGLTPNLDALARQSIVFTRAYAQVPLTTPSHAALLTGTYPQFNHVEVLRDPLREDLPYVPDLLHRHGYNTAAFVGSMILDPASGAPGFDRGFDVYDAGFHMANNGEDRYHAVERRAQDVADRGLGWLSRNREGPFFIWLHFFDPHDPYDPPKEFKDRYKSDPYDGEIAYTDSVIGKVTDFLKRNGLFERSLIAVAADHGEAFGEHGEKRHGLLLYDETIHVPLLLKLPGQKLAGTRTDTRVALADVAPTLLQTAGITVPSDMQARSLFSLLDNSNSRPDSTGEEGGTETVYSETDYARRTLGWSELRSWRAGKYLYIHAPKQELYDETSDPKALRNIAPSAKAVAETLDAQLADFRRKTGTLRAGAAKLDPAQVEGLHALGYLASDGGKENLVEKSAVDPKDKVEIANLLQEAIVALEENRYDDAMANFHRVVKDSDADNAYLEFGIDLVRHKRYHDAVPLLRKAAEKLPGSASARYEFGIALINSGEWEAALPEIQAAVNLKPEFASLRFTLAAVNIRLNRLQDAETECKKALEIEPNHFDANLTYGKLLLKERRPEAALLNLSRAVYVKPDSAEAHFFLAEAYHQLGRESDAEGERAKAAELNRRARE
jgi:choline-sulfatase